MVGKFLMRNAPVIGSVYNFVETAVNVYNCTNPSQAAAMAAKGIFIECTPPVIKYPALCAGLAACFIASVATHGNPYVLSATCTVGETILHCIAGD